MRNIMKAALIAFASISIAQFASAQQFAPQKVLTDLTPEQVKQINALGGIPNKEVTSPVYDFHLSKILTPAQVARYNELKDGTRQTGTVDYQFNIDGK
ncbi:MAG TPA: hypothetical protein H9889_00085 [Candidatus Ignatzschineria merdigallinarum]|uniref:Lipoprotein SmpA/OmlA domain-containing protein n=1 Tax=Candidatus Ignatzschineria merdigallinarum TaxID=2838621 RepID=A0A9D1TTK9_9GAMM|nr:hypothetical protein [Candidatus Ignatzschineria merdigallinarum]